MTFDIREHIESLNHLGRGRYNCPVCNSKNFTINKKTGAYKCWANECANEEIRQAIAPVDGVVTDYGTKTKSKPKIKAKPVIIADIPTWKSLPGDRTYPKRVELNGCVNHHYEYGDGLQVIRTDARELPSGEKIDKIVLPHFLNDKKRWQKGKGDRQWDAYRLSEVIEHCNDGSWVFAVEGEKTVEAMRYLGFPCITWQGGSWTDKDLSRTIVQLKAAAIEGLIFIPDNDEPGEKKAAKVSEACAKHSYPCLVLNPLDIWNEMPEKGDIADFAKAHLNEDLGEYFFDESFEMAIECAFENQKIQQPAATEPAQSDGDRPIVAETTRPLAPAIPETRRIHGGYKDLKVPELDELITDAIGDRLKFDDLRCEVLLGDDVFTFDAALRLWFFHEFGETAPKEDIYATMLYHAKRKSFNPVTDYLTQCHQSRKKISIDNIATRYLGTDQPIYDRMVKMWLISCVARMFDPGCQVDHTLILQSGQGKYKSTFFKVLAGEWFDDSVKDIEKPDTMLTVHSSWIIELSELDRITSKKQAGAVKHFLTKRQDTFRKPYGKEVERYDRRAVFCGTVNPAKFLVDDENRRFWVVPIADHINAIDINLLAQERDGLWASAVEAYKNGEIWYPNDEEKAEIAALNKDFRDLDVWAEPIEDWISDRPFVSTYEILSELFKMGNAEIQRRDQMRVTKVLDMLGWTKTTRRAVHGKYRNVRLNPNQVEEDKNPLFAHSKTVDINNNSSKVSMVGISTEDKGFQDYRPTYQPPNEVGIQQGQYIPTSTDQVCMPETIAETGFDRPTDLDTPIPAKYSRGGFQYPIGQCCYIKNTNEIVAIKAFPGVGGDFRARRYLVQWLDGKEDWVQQANLVPMEYN